VINKIKSKRCELMLSTSTFRLKCIKPSTILSLSLRRSFSSSTVRRFPLENVLDGSSPQPVQVTAVSSAGIEMADGLVITSSCIFLGGKVFLWKVPSTLWNGWDKERFEIFEVTIPKPGEPQCLPICVYLLTIFQNCSSWEQASQ
jgi:NADH dehydrogenase [ubiquinone] 1 alpha subcomplex assembly factor 3